MSILKGIKWYYELCGLKGSLAIASFRILGRPEELTIVPPNCSRPVHLRIDTSDFCSYRDVLVFQTKTYTPPLPDFSPKVIVDVGAHIGITSILYALKYPAAKIIALEPEAANFAALVRNITGYKAITPINAALWAHDGEVRLGPCNAHVKGAFAIMPEGPHKVRSLSMETLMREAGVENIDLLKIDIEGAEKDIFDGCRWIDKVKVLAIELHDRLRPGCSKVVKSACSEFSSKETSEITFFFAKTVCADTSYSADALAPRVASSRSPAA